VEPVIDVVNLSCRYRKTEAVRGISFAVQPGTVFALLGPNGAGKTTTIRAVMNILRPSGGEARVLGTDSRHLGPNELQTIGYVSENQELPTWMTVAELLAYCRPFYPTWDERLSRKLLDDFELPAGVRISRLSRGMRVKAALVSALAYRPRLLILDEPFSGLDPVVRDDLVHGVLERAGEGQWSVLISSHDLDEVERLIDTVAFLDGGRIIVCEALTALQGRFRRVDVTVANGEASPHGGTEPGWMGMTSAGRIVRFTDTSYAGEPSDARIALRFPGARVEVQPMTLREVFVALARHTRGQAPGGAS
jgi:ABC-2 type transport system ATP-binding protein